MWGRHEPWKCPDRSHGSQERVRTGTSTVPFRSPKNAGRLHGVRECTLHFKTGGASTIRYFLVMAYHTDGSPKDKREVTKEHADVLRTRAGIRCIVERD